MGKIIRRRSTHSIPTTLSSTIEPCIGCLFLDSGAHSLYTKQVIKKKHAKGYDFYESAEFYAYVDDYIEFIKKHKQAIDHFVNVDVIFNPEKSWEMLKYMEKAGLKPLPVIHWGTDLKWIKKHLDAGYDFIGLGGLGQEVSVAQYHEWADKVYEYLCPKPSCLPIVKTHGFAMTAYELMIKWPWFSVDSASWVKAGGFGQIFVPHKRGGKFTFGVKPYNISVSAESPSKSQKGKHVYTISKGELKVVKEWLEQIDMPYGSVDKDGEEVEYGVTSNHAARKIANLKFFQGLIDWLPKWPWPFRGSSQKGFF